MQEKYPLKKSNTVVKIVRVCKILANSLGIYYMYIWYIFTIDYRENAYQWIEASFVTSFLSDC